MIIYKSAQEIEQIRRSNQVVAQVLSELRYMIKPGVETLELDRYAEKRAQELGAVPAFKGYRGYPASLCTSINEEIVHGIPSKRKLRAGDILSLDFGAVIDGFYGDAAVTVAVGEITPAAQKLMTVVEESFYIGLEKAVPGNRISDISAAVQTYVESFGFAVIRSFVGHGIGFSLHEEPQVPNFGEPGHGPKIKPGMVLAIEPMISIGDWDVEVLTDNWTAVTKDRSLSAHYEHTIAVTGKGPEILSQWAEDEDAAQTKEFVHV
ncbi:MAG: type I methionyl aminopeptidase [Candidatus Aminicenantes bacterium]|nr:type I methionyl aminopeptidase [Candidatus Aminicenantes bacterium]